MTKPTIYEALKATLQREPTHAELCADVRRILGFTDYSQTAYASPREQRTADRQEQAARNGRTR